MSKHINQVEIRFPDNRDALIGEAVSCDESCVSVGGLAESLGMLETLPLQVAVPAIGAKAFAKLVEFWRRQRQLSVEDLAARAGLSEAEVLDAEEGDAVPEPRVLYALSCVLKVSYEKLLHLTGHVMDRDQSVETAAIRFAARSESMERLNRQEEEALHEFILALGD